MSSNKSHQFLKGKTGKQTSIIGCVKGISQIPIMIMLNISEFQLFCFFTLTQSFFFKLTIIHSNHGGRDDDIFCHRDISAVIWHQAAEGGSN